MDKIKEKIKKLQEDLDRYSYYYYTKNQSLISDVEFDRLMKELEDLEEKYPELKNERGISSRVGAIELSESKFEKVKHSKPMLSLGNSYNIEDVLNFMERIEKILKEKNEKLGYILELKLDGASISIQYKNGKLFKAITRGDGIEGEDVTENILQIESIPHYLKENIDVEVRGEIVLPISSFKKLNEKRFEAGEELFANPRNAASGTLRQLDSVVVKERGLDAYFYFLMEPERYGIKTHRDSLKYIEKLGLKTTGVYEECFDSKDMKDRINYWEIEREKLDYETDGLVIKLNNLEFWEEVGFTTKSPRWAIAYKFPAKQVSTKLLGVTWQVGRTGKITPVAELEEVELSGSRIKRASLHNIDEINRKDIRIGDRVFIEKAAEIIPQVVSSIKEERTGEEIVITEPKYCPVCKSELIREEGLVDLKCNNYYCLSQIKGRIEHFVSRDGMNIAGLGNKIIEKFQELGYLKDVSDIYTLKERRDELEKIDKLGTRSIDNLLISIEKSKTREYSKSLFALGIPFVGKYSAEILAKESNNIDNLMKMKREELLGIEGIGEKTVDSLEKFFSDVSNIQLIERLKKSGVNYQSNIADTVLENSKFGGKTFLFTGKLKNYTRDEIKEKIEQIGGINLNSVSKKLDYLIIGEKAGSKLKKAEEIGGIEILTEEEFEKLINEN